MSAASTVAKVRSGRAPVFHGWWIVSGSFFILFVSVGLGLYVPPVLLVPLQEQFGWSRASITTGTSLAAVAGAIVSPLVGGWIDRFGARVIMTVGTLVMCLAMGFLSAMGSLWELYAINIFTSAGLTCVAWVPNQTLIANWFERKRGLAMGIAMTGIGFGGLLMAPCAAWLIAEFGWRFACATLAAVSVVIVTVVVLATVRDRPQDMGLLPDGLVPDAATATAGHHASRGAGLDAAQATWSWTFWVLSLGNFLNVFAQLSIVAHMVAILRDAGFEGRVAAGALGLTVGVSVAGRILFGYLADRASRRAVIAGGFGLCLLSTLLLLNIKAVGMLPAFVIVFGLALGGVAVMIPLLVGESFGLLAFGKILGRIMVSGTLGAAVGPVLTGRIYDATGSYKIAFIIHAVAFIGAGLTFLFLPRPAPPRAD